MFRSLKKAVIERAMSAEMSGHLGYGQGEAKPAGQSNQRNGSSGKTVITDDGPLRIEVPRDREGNFEPQIIGKHERRFTGFDQEIIAMYARGMTVREIQGYLAEMYGTEVSPEFISKVTDEVMTEVTALAEPAARADVAGGVLRCPASENPRRRRRAIVQSWRRAWENVIPFFAFPPLLKACTCSCERSSRLAATSPTTMPPSSCCGWHFATSLRADTPVRTVTRAYVDRAPPNWWWEQKYGAHAPPSLPA